MSNAEVISTTHVDEFKRWKKFSQIVLVLVILLSIPLTVFLVNRFILYVSQAAPNAHLFLHTGGDTKGVPNSRGVIFELALEGGDLVAADYRIKYDTSMVRLHEVHSLNSKLETVVFDTSISEANSTGEYRIIVADDPDGGNTFDDREEMAQFIFVPAPGASGDTRVDVDMQNIQLVNSDALEYRIASHSPAHFSVQDDGSSTADTDLWLQPRSSEVGVGQDVLVDVMANPNSNRVVGTEMYITYDTRFLKYESVEPGGFIINPDVVEKDISGGLISYTLVNGPDSQTPSTSQGIVATIKFQGRAVGTSALDFTGDTKVGAVNTGAVNVLKSATGTSIVVVDALPSTTPGPCNEDRPGDINQDCAVDILDYVIWYENFGLTPPNNPRADINTDGSVDILDYVIWYENFDFVVNN